MATEPDPSDWWETRPAANRQALQRVAWAHVTSRFRTLGFDFRVRTTEPVLGAYLDELFEVFREPGTAAHTLSLVDSGPSAAPRRFVVYLDDQRLTSGAEPAPLVAHLLWQINHEVVETTPDLLLIHSSAAELDGRAALFPAPTGSGKTTLVAGLVRSGFRYITDEAVAIDPVTHLVHPYPKPLAIEHSAQAVLPELAPHVDQAVEPYLNGRWYVQPAAIRSDAVAPICRPGLVIAPRYRPGTKTTLTPISRAAALVLLTDNAFNLEAHGRAGFRAFGEIIRRCECFELVFDDLGRACEIVADVVEGNIRT